MELDIEATQFAWNNRNGWKSYYQDYWQILYFGTRWDKSSSFIQLSPMVIVWERKSLFVGKEMKKYSQCTCHQNDFSVVHFFHERMPSVHWNYLFFKRCVMCYYHKFEFSCSLTCSIVQLLNIANHFAYRRSLLHISITNRNLCRSNSIDDAR